MVLVEGMVVVVTGTLPPSLPVKPQSVPEARAVDKALEQLAAALMMLSQNAFQSEAADQGKELAPNLMSALCSQEEPPT